MNETEAIFKIVLRNLALSNWADLETEAQVQMLEEAAILINSTFINMASKQQLTNCLKNLKYSVSDLHKERINTILRVEEEEKYLGDIAS